MSKYKKTTIVETIGANAATPNKMEQGGNVESVIPPATDITKGVENIEQNIESSIPNTTSSSVPTVSASVPAMTEVLPAINIFEYLDFLMAY